MTKLDNYNERGSESVVLFFETLYVNICKLYYKILF